MYKYFKFKFRHPDLEFKVDVLKICKMWSMSFMIFMKTCANADSFSWAFLKHKILNKILSNVKILKWN